MAALICAAVALNPDSTVVGTSHNLAARELDDGRIAHPRRHRQRNLLLREARGVRIIG